MRLKVFDMVRGRAYDGEATIATLEQLRELDRYRKALEDIAAVENWVEDPRLPAQIAQDALDAP